uniref:PAX3- and PAX7-binding protein 1 n=1 Tax=Cacopsylla melanoneura TaxID=428564 RepID=A0A8D8QFC5_9HEMI
MFKKPKRNIRRREQSDENDEDSGMDVDEAKEEEKPKEKSKPKPLHQPPKKTTILSFAEEFEEDEEEVFQVKKSSQSRKFRRQAGKEKEEKDKDKERRKKKDEENGVENSSHRKNEKIVTTNEVTLKIKNPIAGPIKSLARYQPILNGREAEAAEVGGISSDEEVEEDRRRGSKKKSGHSFAKPDYMKEILKSGEIPDAAMIHAARKRRQKAREMGDYVQISEKPAQAQPTSVDQNKRLVHEDDEQDGSESEEERVDMSNINMAAVDRKNRQDAYDSVQRLQNEESDSEKEGEDDAWEKQQIRKGVTGTQLSIAQADSSLFITATTAGSYHVPYAPPTDPSHPPLPPLPSSLPSSILSSLATQSNICTPGEIVSSLKTRYDRTPTHPPPNQPFGGRFFHPMLHVVLFCVELLCLEKICDPKWADLADIKSDIENIFLVTNLSNFEADVKSTSRPISCCRYIISEI